MKKTVSILAAGCFALVAAPAFSEGMATDAMSKDKMGKQEKMAKKHKAKKKMDKMEKQEGMSKDKMGK